MKIPPSRFCLAVLALALLLPAPGRTGERLLFDDEVTLTAKETAFPSQLTNLVSPDDFRTGTLHARYEVRSMASADHKIALQACLKAPDGAHTCVTCVSVTKPGVYTIDRPLAKMFKSSAIDYGNLTSLVLVAKAERCNNHDEPPAPLKAQYYPLTLRATVVLVPAGATFSGWDNYPPRRTLDLYFIDVEGGAATLIVTPAGESVLIDAGNPGGRDAGRIHRAATVDAGLTRIDHYVTTHFHTDHFGGAAELAALLPIGEVYDNGLPAGHPDGRPNDPRWPLLIKPYVEFKSGSRHVLSAGGSIPLQSSAGGPALSLRCLAARQKFADAPAGATPNPLCAQATTKAADLTDNANSIVLVLDCGPFRFFAGGDLTWNTEAGLVCPVNLAGPVDVYQVDHHGMDISNNPVLVHSLAPTVAVMTNGPRKGASAAAFTTLRTSPGLVATYQLHKSLRPEVGPQAPDDFIANFAGEGCAGNLIKLSVAPDAKSYTITIPATGWRQTYQTRLK